MTRHTTILTLLVTTLAAGSATVCDCRCLFACVQPQGGIDRMWVGPDDSTDAAPITVHVTGQWPGAECELIYAGGAACGDVVWLDMHWCMSGWGACVVTPYRYVHSFGPLAVGKYTVIVHCFLNGELVDTAERSVGIRAARGCVPCPWGDLWTW